MKQIIITPQQARNGRRSIGMNQRHLAEAGGLSRYKISQFETGTLNPDAEFLRNLRSFLESQGADFNAKEDPLSNGAEVSGDDGHGHRRAAIGEQQARIAVTHLQALDNELRTVLDENVKYLGLLIEPTALQGSSEATRQRLRKLLVARCLLMLRLDGRELAPPLTPQPAEEGTCMNTQRELLSQDFAYLHEEIQVVDKPLEEDKSQTREEGPDNDAASEESVRG